MKKYNLEVFAETQSFGDFENDMADKILKKWSKAKTEMSKIDVLNLLEELSNAHALEFNVLMSIMFSIGVLSLKQMDEKEEKKRKYS